jgi:hypothetical protein
VRDAAFKNVLARGQLRQLDPVLGYEALGPPPEGRCYDLSLVIRVKENS